MKILFAIIAGIAGTLAMTAFLYLLTFITHKQMKVVKILGTMLTNNTQPGGKLSESKTTIIVGAIGHYSVGISFAIVYLILWHFGIGKPDFVNALIFGGVSGIAAIGIWYGFVAVHPNPPDIPLKSYLLTIFLGHFVFALTEFYTYLALDNLVK
jgi:hypothetical protein